VAADAERHVATADPPERRLSLPHEKLASDKRSPRRPEWTTCESADRSRADACFALGEQASEQAGPARLVLVLSESEWRLARDGSFRA
jgi:hypothetical protein